MSKSRVIGVISFFVFAGVAVWFFGGRDVTIKNYPPKGNIIAAFGDSLVEGVGASPGNDFVSVVSRRLGRPIVNFGISGDTTASALLRIDGVVSEKPGIVLVLIGGNDALSRVPIERTETNLRQIIARFQDSGAVIVVLGVRGGILGDPYESMYERVARESGSVYVENILKGLFGNVKYMHDAIHPNDAGYARIAERVLPALTGLLR